MLPSIAPGTELRIACGAEPHAGDVVLAVGPGGLVVHRLLLLTPRFAVMRGDGTVVPDPAIRRDDIFGIVVSEVPAPPRSIGRSVFAIMARVLLGLGYGLNQRMTHLLWLGRGAVGRARALSGTIVVPEEEGDRREPEGQ